MVIPCYRSLVTTKERVENMKNLVVNGVTTTNYFIDENGTVYTSEKIPMKAHKMANGYLRVKLRKDIPAGLYLVHRLVAETFIPNPKGLPIVNHKDSKRDNNHVSNLEWCDNSHNQKQRFMNGYKGTKRKTVQQIDLKTDEIINEWESPIDAENATGVARQNVSKVCRGLRNHAGGFRWRYVD